MQIKFLPLLVVLTTWESCLAAHCPPGQTEMSVEHAEGVFCVEELPVCVADNADGNCPGPQPGLELGAHCGVVASGVYGCKMNTEEPQNEAAASPESQCDSGESPVSVEGAEGVYCATEPVCVADRVEGACPGPQDGLEHGSHCGVVSSGVYGCKKNSGETTNDEYEEDDVGERDYESSGEGECEEDESPMSVEGVEGVFCATEPVCVADRAEGACPEAQEGLEMGAYCGIVASGVYGCKKNMTIVYEEGSTSSSGDGIIEASCGNGESPMSVEGIEGIFCVTEPACVAHNSDGTCPGPQDGLETGSHCDIVRTGVYGCKPGMPWAESSSGSFESEIGSGSSESGSQYIDESGLSGSESGSSTWSIIDCTDNEAGDISVYVKDRGNFCAFEPICSGAVLGNCPGSQDGLEYDSVCGNIENNSFGCVIP